VPGPEFAVLDGLSAVEFSPTGRKTILASTHVYDLCTRLH